MDYTQTNNPTSLFKAASVHPFPEWADSEPIPHQDGLRDLANAAFADPGRRLLPIHTKAVSFFSMIDFLDRPSDFGLQAGERVKTACEQHGILNEMGPWLVEADDNFTKSASPASYAINTEIGDTVVRLFPMMSAEDVREAVTGLTKMAAEKRIDYVLLREAAMNVIEKSAAVGGEINDLVASFAVTQFTDVEKSARLVAGRGANEHEQQAYNDIVQELVTSNDPETAVIKLAAADIAFGRDNHQFANTRLRPHELVYCGEPLADLQKAAAEQVFVLDVMVPRSALKAIDPCDIEFGLSKQAGVSFDPDHADIGDIIGSWDVSDQKTLLYLAAHA